MHPVAVTCVKQADRALRCAGPYAVDPPGDGRAAGIDTAAPVRQHVHTAAASAGAGNVLPRRVRAVRPEVVAAAKELMAQGVPLELATAQAELRCEGTAGRSDKKSKKRDKKDRKDKKRRKRERRRGGSSSGS